MLLDTHVWIWLVSNEPKRLGPRITRKLAGATGERAAWISTASAFEIAALNTAGRIRFSQPIDRWIRDSIDRSSFPLGIEEALVIGSHVPLQLVKDLKPLPEKLESKLTTTSGEFRAYTLGRHVLLVRKPDFVIADIIKNVAVK